MDLESAMTIAAAGMKAQSVRLRVTAENLANAESTASTPGGDPFQRKTVSFANRRDAATGLELVTIDRYGVDRSPFERRYEPGHPAADAAGYVKYPNVNPLLELADMREAQRSYEANLNALQLARAMIGRTLDLLR
ncbi:flagellar basal body rod protein FlgC [Benzoatithermus flavus]|uniref:Flagellar basal-body rod protein FlgC n=1 Tax=Benzoatithermus flavus TaxID=3108223 RepID=A0ABU8XXX0_9PROT